MIYCQGSYINLPECKKGCFHCHMTPGVIVTPSNTKLDSYMTIIDPYKTKLKKLTLVNFIQ